MGRRKKITSGVESVLEGARLPVEQLQPPGKKTSALITVPAALVAIATIIFALVKLIKFAWFF